MTTDELITRARRALETGQPNLAMLYMRKAAQQVEEHRRQLDPWRTLRANLRDFSTGLEKMAHALNNAILEVAREIFPAAAAAAAELDTKTNYALVGPAK